MPEWLRGLTRNQMGFPRAGSNPAGDARTIFIDIFIQITFQNLAQVVVKCVVEKKYSSERNSFAPECLETDFQVHFDGDPLQLASGLFRFE